MREHLISGVLPDSIGEELKIKQGDRLISINGSPIFDCFDYLYYNASESLTLAIRKENGRGGVNP